MLHVHELPGLEAAAGLFEGGEWLEPEVFDRRALRILKELRETHAERLDVPGLGGQPVHDGITQQKLVAESVFGERNVGRLQRGVAECDALTPHPRRTQWVPDRLAARAAYVQAAAEGHEPVRVEEEDGQLTRQLVEELGVIEGRPGIRDALEGHQKSVAG
jgi:hypothetical protein